MIQRLLVGSVLLVSAVLGYGQAAGAQRPSENTAATAAAVRAVLDQYCVTCHNDRTRRANLSLEKLDLSDRKSTRLNSSHLVISYAVFCLKKKNQTSTSPSSGTCTRSMKLCWPASDVFRISC